MLRIWLVGILLLCLLGQARLSLGEAREKPESQVQPAKVKVGEVHQLQLGRSLEILEDPSAQLDLNDIVSGKHDADFKASTRDFPGLNNPTAHFWLKLTVWNQSTEARDLLLENRYPLLDYLTLYQKQADGSYSELTLGDEVSYEHRSIAFRFPVYPIRLEAGTQTYYLKLQNKGTFVVSLFLWDSKSFGGYAKADNVVLGFLYGCLIVLLLYNTFLMFSFRSITYAVYVAYLVAFIGSQFGIQATGIEWVGGSVGHWLMNRGWLPLVSASHVFGCLFAIRFLNMREHMRNWRKWMYALVAINACIAIHGLFGPYAIIGKEVTYSTVVVCVALIASGVTAARRGFRPAIFYGMAWLCLLTGNLLLTLMFNGLFPLNFIAQWGNLIGGALEVALMSLALGSRVNFRQTKSELTIKSLNNALTVHIAEVEQTVLERTQTIRSIIDHVKSGFFTINNQLLVEAGFTKSCYKLLGDRIADQVSILDVLGLEGSRRSIFQMTVQQVFADVMPEVVSLSQIPKSFRIGDTILILEGGVIRNEAGQPKAILFTLNDITKLRLKQREAMRSSMLIKILKNMDAFRSFIKITRENINQLRDPEIRHKAKMVAFILHTIKGNCLIFNMKPQADLVHKLEESPQLELADIDSLEQSFQVFLNRHADILSLTWDEDQDDDIVVKHSSLIALKSELINLGLHKDFIEYYEHWVRGISAQSARSILGPILDDVQLLAKRTGRRVQFDLLGAEVKIYSDSEKALIKNLVHLVRNAILHGIEVDRAAVQKPNKGQLVLMFKASPGQLQIHCKDDGRGIDRQHIVQLIVERGLAGSGDIDKKSISDLIETLSLEGFSTSKEIDLYAGRGVGVAAVYGAVKACGGSMEIKSQAGLGTEFIITLPRHEEAYQPNLQAV